MKIIIIKKKSVLLIIGLIISMIVIISILNSLKEVPVSSLPTTNKIIVIDPGHGGVDPGAISDNGKKEKDITLNISLKLKRLLEQSGTVVILTRSEDVGLYTEKSRTYSQKKNEDLRNRRIMVNDIAPDIFITIHLNSFPQKRYYGAQTFYQKGSEKGKRLAELIQEELKNVLDKNNKRVPQSRDTIYLLREVNATSILVECGFLSNANEARQLCDTKYQEKIAWSIYTGIIRYFNEENSSKVVLDQE